MTEPKLTPPPELVEQWFAESSRVGADWPYKVAAEATQWGADQELLACGNYLKQCAQWEEEDVTEFYNYRRPRPPSLKEQALALVEQHEDGWRPSPKDWDTIRRALEQLDD
jgi:hypothetical protein